MARPFLNARTAVATLAGLILVAVSLHLHNLLRNIVARRRAFINIFGLGVYIVNNSLVLMPQPTPALGAELLVINMAWVCGPLSILFRFRRQLGAEALARLSAGTTCCSLGILGGLCPIFGINHAAFVAGMYATALNSIGTILLVILNAWAMIAGLYTDEPGAAPSTSASADTAPC